MNKYILRIPIKAEAITRTRDDFEKQMSPWRYKETYAKNEKEARRKLAYMYGAAKCPNGSKVERV